MSIATHMLFRLVYDVEDLPEVDELLSLVLLPTEVKMEHDITMNHLKSSLYNQSCNQSQSAQLLHGASITSDENTFPTD